MVAALLNSGALKFDRTVKMVIKIRELNLFQFALMGLQLYSWTCKYSFMAHYVQVIFSATLNLKYALRDGDVGSSL